MKRLVFVVSVLILACGKHEAPTPPPPSTESTAAPTPAPPPPPATKAQAFGLGANDYLVKLPDRIELIARIRHHSRGYVSLLQRNEAYEALAESRKQLADQIDAAARYLRSLLPGRWQKVIKNGNTGEVHYFEHASGYVAGVKYFQR